MARRDHRHGGRTTPKGTRPLTSISGGRDARPGRHEPPLLAEARSALREATPFHLLAHASAMVEVTTERSSNRWSLGAPSRLGTAQMLESFVESGYPEMAALALAASVMIADPMTAARVRLAAKARVPSAPSWLATMGDIEIIDTVMHGDVLGDGDNVVVSWRWPDGNEASALVYIDHNLGTIVKDAFVIPEGPAALADMYVRASNGEVMQSPLPSAEAKARIVEAIRDGDMMLPPRRTETWPVCRPMIEWVLRHLPDGGTGYLSPEWPMPDREALLDEFVASPFGAVAGLQPDQVRDIADPLVWFACDYGPGDPLRWSAVSVEIVLTDWYPGKVLGLSPSEVRHTPDVLAGFVRFAHQRRGIPAKLTAETLASVERWRGEFYEIMNDEFMHDEFTDDEFMNDHDMMPTIGGRGVGGVIDEEYMTSTVNQLEAHVVEMLGGRDAYESVTDEPLGDVAFDWSMVRDDLHDVVAETLALQDRWASDLYDDEVRSIARVVLAAVVRADPALITRSPRPDAIAASLLRWVQGHLVPRGRSSDTPATLGWAVTTQKDLAARTGVSAATIGSRSQTIAKVVERADIDWPSILHSSQRRRAINTKQMVEEWRRTHP